MAQHTDTGVTTYAGIAVILLLAVGALLLFKFNLFGVQDMLSTPDDGHSSIPVRDPLPGGDGAAPEVTSSEIGPMPPDEKYFVKHDPLPQRLSYPVKVGDYTADIELCLVPQGWFIMGENDRVRSNEPKRWVWLDDYYIASTETTNDQMFAFILADGYRHAPYWSPEGFRFASSQIPNRGTPDIGWHPLGSDRLWALKAPNGDVTLQAMDKKSAPVTNMQMLVLPSGGEWEKFFDTGEGNPLIRERETWQHINGEGISKEALLKNYLRTTDEQGRLQLSDLSTEEQYRVLAWPDGLTEPAMYGTFRRSASSAVGQLPATGMSWFEADACCRFFGGMLPSEAQWEKAGRGADGRHFPWGNDLEMNMQAPIANGGRQTTRHANLNLRDVKPVGSYPSGASQYGVLDLVGNVSEWCNDVYIEVPVWTERNPLHVGGAKDRKAERGSNTEDDDPQIAKLHNRRSSDPYFRLATTRGFRLVMDVETALKNGKPK